MFLVSDHAVLFKRELVRLLEDLSKHKVVKEWDDCDLQKQADLSFMLLYYAANAKEFDYMAGSLAEAQILVAAPYTQDTFENNALKIALLNGNNNFAIKLMESCDLLVHPGNILELVQIATEVIPGSEAADILEGKAENLKITRPLSAIVRPEDVVVQFEPLVAKAGLHDRTS